MKALPKRKGNVRAGGGCAPAVLRLNESPSEKEGKSEFIKEHPANASRLNESPSEKEGKFRVYVLLMDRLMTPQ